MHVSALVVSTGRNSAWISIEGETTPRIAQLRRMAGKRFMPVPGDKVEATILEDGRAVVDRIEPRASSLQRRTAVGRAKTMAANIDLLITVTALADPPPRLVTLDQLLAFAELKSIAAAVVLTKSDLADPTESAALRALYAALDYRTISINPKRGENLDELRSLLRGHHALLAGVSGVGKSTIFRTLGGEATVGNLSRHGLGRQTTTAARLYRIGPGFLIDSPGLGEFGLGRIAPAELASAFREMRELALQCRFADCTHLAEPDCAIRNAVVEGHIAASRYASYSRILGNSEALLPQGNPAT
ncbi:MAG: ribosome small subunit-dependent GTPase A [Candidatus Eremiobacteraeota bacterium]|nr:ribosome small subunit-dependent GTPase A [Candidatus Eremiobacteraeota bacterium]